MNIFQAIDSRRYSSVCRPVKFRASSYNLSPKIIRKANLLGFKLVSELLCETGMPHRTRIFQNWTHDGHVEVV